jgi:hypothetical protein
MHPLIQKAIDIAGAAADAHVHEVGYTNTGREVNAYLADVGLPPGLAWCAAFASWCLDTAGAALGYRIPYRSGSCPDIETWARAHGILHETGPHVGDWCLLQEWDAAGQYSGHIGIVTAIHSDGSMETIEGNTSSGSGGSQTDGGGVYRRTRTIGDWYFVRWIDAVTPLTRPIRVEMVDAAGGARAIDCHASLEAGRTRADVRPLAEALGGYVDTHLAAQGLYTLAAGDRHLSLLVGSVDEGRPAVEGGRLRAELRHVAEGLGYQVDTSQFATGLIRLRQ